MTSADEHPRLRIDVWADVVCPACYVADHRLRAAIDGSGHRDRIDLVLHAFELHPGTPDEVLDNSAVLADLMGASIEQVEAMEERFAALARADGLPFEIRRKHRNTRTIHQVLRLAAEHGVASDLMATLQTAAFGGDAQAFDHEYLVQASVTLGLPEARVRAVIAADDYGPEVDADRAAALALGARGVPFTVFDGRFAVPGAAGVDVYRQAIAQAIQSATESATEQVGARS